MTLSTIYPLVVGGGVTRLTADYTPGNISVTVEDASGLPTPPNYISIIDDTHVITLLYSSITSNMIGGLTTVEYSPGGNSHTYNASSVVGRAINKADMDAIVNNLDEKVNIEDIVDNVTSVDTDKPLSANQGKVLQGEIDALSIKGRFLSGWNCLTGLPDTDPVDDDEYTYKSGDYYVVSSVSTTNLIPSGTSYTKGTPSTTTTTDTVGVGDQYYFDGAVWTHIPLVLPEHVSDVKLDGTSIVTGGVVNLHTASDSEKGLLSASDYSEFKAKQDALTFDAVPTVDSNNPVKSGGVYTGLAGKVDKVTGSSLVEDDKVDAYDEHITDGDIHVTTAQKEAWTAKVDKNQGAAYAGLYLAVGNDGNVTLKEDGKVYTFTIPYTDTSANIQYYDDAYGTTEARRRDIIRSWARHAIVKNGVVQYWLDDNNLNKKEDGAASDLTGTDGDVMLLYKPLWWRCTHTDDGDTTISIADWDFDPGNTVTAHRYGASTICSYLGLGVFEGTMSGSSLVSVNVSAKPAVSKTNDAFYNAAIAGRTVGHYNQTLPLTWTLYAILLLFEGGNRDTQAKYGAGWTKSTNTAACNVNQDWSATSPWNSATVYTDGEHGVTALGIHNKWGNVWEFLGEFLKDTDDKAYFTVQGGYDHQLISATGQPDTWHSVQMTGVTGAYVKDIIGDVYTPFLPRTTGASATTYWADYCYSSTTQRNCGLVCGTWNNASRAGLFTVTVADAVGFSRSDIGSRIQVLIE